MVSRSRAAAPGAGVLTPSSLPVKDTHEETSKLRGAPAPPPCPAAGKPVVQHTRATDYTNHGCRCPEARRDRERRRKTRHLLPPVHVPAVGARRRLRALVAIGWSQDDLNEQLGRKRSGSLGPLLWDDNRATVRAVIFDRVCDLYERLWATPGPSRRSREAAAARGWPPPLWWDDDLIDDPQYQESNDFTKERHRSPRAIAREEFTARVAELSRIGWSATRIAEETGRSARDVVRARARIRQDLSPSSDTFDVEEVAC